MRSSQHKTPVHSEIPDERRSGLVSWGPTRRLGEPRAIARSHRVAALQRQQTSGWPFESRGLTSGMQDAGVFLLGKVDSRIHRDLCQVLLDMSGIRIAVR